MTTTVEDLVNWSLANKLPAGLASLSMDQLRLYFLKANREERLVVDFSPSGEILGYVTYRKTIHVEEIQCKARNSFKKLILFLGQKFPEFSAEATRHGKLKTYNVSKLVNRI